VSTSRWHRRVRLLCWILGLGMGVAMVVAGAAYAYWTATITSGSNYAEASAQTVPTGSTPTATVTPASGQTVTVTFTQSSTSGGTPLTAYTVERYASGSGTSVPISGSCAIASSVVTCTDVPGSGTWQYTDLPTIGTNWVGTASAKSTGVIVQALPTLSVAATSSVVVATALTPSATLAGATSSPSPGGSVSFSVLGPQSSAPSSCTGAGWSSVGSAVAITANGTYNASTSFTPSTAGTYWWYASYTGDSDNAAANSGCTSTSTTVHLALSPSTLAAATVYGAYSQTISASGGASPYSFALTSGTLPAGLTLTSGGVLSGTVNTAGQNGSYAITVTATDGDAFTGSASYTLVVDPPPIVLSPTTLTNPTGEASYSKTISASGGASAYTYAVTSGALPTGLSLAGATGVVSGTESGPGSFSFTITATDAHGYTGSQAYSVTVVNPTITLSPSTLAAATVYGAYSQTISASGGASPYSFALTSGTLPAGLTLTSGGVLSGTVNTAGQNGSYAITVTATDGDAFTGSASYTLVVDPPPIVLSPTTLTNPTGEASYSKTISASGGASAYTYAVTSGALPTGLSLAGATGVVSGTESGPGSFSFTITATDAHGYTGSQAYSVTVVNPTITLSPTSMPGAVGGLSYSQTITASGGVGPYTYAITGGSLAGSGLTLASNGVISGTPPLSLIATYTFTVTATDADHFTGVHSNYTISVAL
jgi:hypothetical protein